jgi:hypothetical protein
MDITQFLEALEKNINEDIPGVIVFIDLTFRDPEAVVFGWRHSLIHSSIQVDIKHIKEGRVEDVSEFLFQHIDTVLKGRVYKKSEVKTVRSINH